MKIELTDLVDLQNETTAVNAINNNNAAVETAVENTLSRDGTSPNQMTAPLDMNSNHILNLPVPVSNYDPIRLMDVNTINGSGITVSPLPAGGTVGQVLTKKSSTNFDTSWVNPVINVFTPEEFGYTTYGSGDAGAAINSAINSVSGPVTINLGPNTYRVVTPIVVSKYSVTITGSGDATIVSFVPAFNNQSLFTWYNPADTNGTYYGGLSNMRITSPDVSFTKIAVNLIDIGDMDVSNLTIGPSWTNGSDCIALQTAGRQTTNFNNLRLFADKPIVIARNPNSSVLSADHFNFTNLYMIALVANPVITANSDVVFTNTTFSGFQSWVGGSYGFYYQGTAASSRGFNLRFENVRREGSSTAVTNTFYVNATSGLVSLVIENCSMDSNCRGLLARGCFTVSLRDVYHPAITPLLSIDVDSTCLSVNIDNCRWESGSTQSIGTLTTKYSYNVAGASPTVPSNALYSI